MVLVLTAPILSNSSLTALRFQFNFLPAMTQDSGFLLKINTERSHSYDSFSLTAGNSTCANTDNKINRFVTSLALAPALNSTLYLDGKTCAIPSLHRDKFLPEVPGRVPGAASGNTY